MILWIKQNGATVETNELPANIEAAEKLGWKRATGLARDYAAEIHNLNTKKDVREYVETVAGKKLAAPDSTLLDDLKTIALATVTRG